MPDSTITVECQDNSKRLVDYFIPDQYTVDYPSYTRYWIQKFLDEAGISYTFNTTSQGNLLSNFTSLGLTSGYEQIMQLLQLSGWYLYFDGNGIARIGSLVKELSSISGTYDKTDILNIAKISDDKMLRNRAVVWGAYNTLFQQYAFADLKTHTRWNYDHGDLRTMVISNSNIPNKASAVRIANILLKEFARITVEKHLTVAGASNKNLGDVVRVRSDVYNGTGMITTFGVSMGRDGLVTNLVLDERCPRLYGFFDFGDYVYVGTYGSGIWRKHIKFVHNWTNFSTGLTNLNITDLHINNDIFGAVAASGEMYYNESSDSNWTPLTITGLMSSVEDQLEMGVDIISGVMGSGVMQTTFSGIMGRATIVDKQSNTIKFGVDTWSELNYGDYFLQYSGLITSSGISESGVNRGWIVEHNPFAGTTEDYPISVSGNFNILVLDLENDGLNDYVSVRTTGTLITGDEITQQYNYGYGGTVDYNSDSKVSLSNITENPSSIVTILNSSVVDVHSFGMIDNVDNHEFFFTRSIFGSVYSIVINKYATTNSQFQLLTSTTVSLGTGHVPFEMDILAPFHSQIVKYGENIYRLLATSGTDVEIITITHNGSESYSVSYNNIDLADSTTGPRRWIVQNGNNAVIVYGKGSDTDPAFYDNTLWYQQVDVLNNSGGPATLVYSSGGTISSRKDILFRIVAYEDGFQTLGWQLEWTSPSSRDAYILSGTGNLVSKGGFHFNTSSSITTLATSEIRLSRTWAAIRTEISGTVYVNYGIHGGSSYASDSAGWAITPIINPEFDAVTFRIRPSSETGTGWGDLQYSAIPITTWTSIDLGDFAPISSIFTRADTITGNIYIYGRHKVNLTTHLLGLNPLTYVVETSPIIAVSSVSIPAPAGDRVFNIGNLITIIFTTAVGSQGIELRVYRNLNPPLGVGGSYLVLQREGYNYSIIQQASKPMRVDISNSSPVLTVQDFENTFVSNYIYGDILDQVITFSGLTEKEVRDYRYTLLESTTETETTPSGGVSQTILYVEASGVWGTSIETLASGFMLLYTIPSGFAERIETSNYIPSGQYIFVTTSGNSPAFYQKDPEDFFFTEYSGLPSSRACIIRVDDRF